ncbi:MAG TPA: hypothetical protein VF756_25290 [Thermoanaerobaculia bacterium]
MSPSIHEQSLETILSDAEGESGPAILHLLTCAECRDTARTQLLAQPLRVRDPLDALLAKLGGELIGELEGERAQAEQLLEELLAVAPQNRSRAVWQGRFRKRSLAERLLEESHRRQEAEPRESARLAHLAAAIAGRFLGTAEDAPARAILVWAGCLAGNAWRLEGRFLKAERALGRAASYLSPWHEPREQGLYCRAVGLLRWEQGRLAEAEALLRQAGRGFAGQGMDGEEAATLALLGLLYTETERTECAVNALLRARSQLDAEARPWLALRAGLSQALGLARLGRRAKARGVRHEMWRLVPAVKDAGELTRAYWLEGRVAVQTGDVEDGRNLLESVRRKLIEERCFGDAALATLDLGALLARLGWAGDVEPLGGEVEAAFPGARGVTELLSGLRALSRAAAQGGAAVDGRRAEASFELRRVVRLAGGRMGTLPFA